jgi:hypothetical protein
VNQEVLSLQEFQDQENRIGVYLTGSRAVGGYTDTSDIDLDILCARSVFDELQRRFLAAGKTQTSKAAFYTLADSNYRQYFGNISPPHFSITPVESVIKRLQDYDEVQMWIWQNAKPVLICPDIEEQLNKSMNGFPPEVLLRKLKRYYLEHLYSVIDAYPAHQHNNETKHLAAFSIYNALYSLFRFVYLADSRPFPYTEKLLYHLQTTNIGSACASDFLEIFNLLEDISGKDAWTRLDKARGMLLFDAAYESARKIDALMTAALREYGCEENWLMAGYDNIDELLLHEID